MYQSISQIIKCVVRKELSEWSDKTLEFKFRLPIDYDKEDGYRFVTFVIHRPNNYIKVYARFEWIVISPDWLTEDGIIEGKDYIENDTGWYLIGDHDSCWDCNLDRFLFLYRNDATLETSFDDFYKVGLAKRDLDYEYCGINELIEKYKELSDPQTIFQ